MTWSLFLSEFVALVVLAGDWTLINNYSREMIRAEVGTAFADLAVERRRNLQRRISRIVRATALARSTVYPGLIAIAGSVQFLVERGEAVPVIGGLIGGAVLITAVDYIVVLNVGAATGAAAGLGRVRAWHFIFLVLLLMLSASAKVWVVLAGDSVAE